MSRIELDANQTIEFIFDDLNISYQKEHRFHDKRRWRFDYAIPEKKIAIEIEGGTWAGGRHTTGAGYEKDCEKYNAAVLLDWKVLRYTTSMIKAKTEMVYNDLVRMLGL